MDSPHPNSIADRATIFAALTGLNLAIAIREPEQFNSHDDYVGCAWSPERSLWVWVEPDAIWGQNLDYFVAPAVEEFGISPRLEIHVPISLDGRVDEVIELVRRWFSGADELEFKQ